MTKYPTPLPLFDTIHNISKQTKPTIAPIPSAIDDFKMARDFLRQYDGNQATFNCYRREIERFLHWAWLIAGKSILALRRNNIEDYIKFCLQPPRSWINLNKVPRFTNNAGKRLPNTAWRPFVVTLSKAELCKGTIPTKEQYTISQKTIKEIFVALSSFYNYLLISDIHKV